jgi:asparagine synthase (glutamine-hydrolysing)
MCAIVGLFAPEATNPDILKSLVGRMQSSHRHCEPDGEGAWSNSHVALGSVRLAIVGDCKLGLQPLEDRWGGHLVFNGEVFESRGILHSLGRNLHPEDSDGVALEAVLAIKGPPGLGRMRGMFAGARYDPGDGSVTLVRDTWGQKPLYLARWRKGWAFSTTIGAPRRGGRLQIRPNAPLEYLIYKSVGGLHSFFEGIEQIAPGSWVQIMPDGSLRKGRYTNPAQDCSAAATAEDVRRELDAAVVARATNHFENAVLLSGGADSSVVGASLVRQRPDLRMRAFSIAYDVSGSEDESEYGRWMAESLRVPHEVVRLHGAEVTRHLEEALLTEDPIEDPVTLPTLLLARRVAQFTKVALSGDGSDEFWGGYARFDNPPASLDEYLPRSMVFRPEELGLSAPPASYLDDVSLPAENLSMLDRILRLEVANRLRNYHLARVDKLGMAAALEIRSPFLDARVTRLARWIPAEIKRPGGRPKGLLLDAFASDLPDWLRNRKKQPFTVPITTWLAGDLRSYARDTLMASDAWVRNFVNPKPYLEKFDQHRELETATRLWSLLQLEAWYPCLAQTIGLGWLATLFPMTCWPAGWWTRIFTWVRNSWIVATTSRRSRKRPAAAA